MADSWITDANKFFVTTYNNLADATKNGASWVAEQTSGSVTWIWGTLKGNWEPNRSDSQIIADAALGFIPLVGQVLDVRDLIACVYALKNEKDTNSQVYKWIDLVLAILGTIPRGGRHCQSGIENHLPENPPLRCQSSGQSHQSLD